MSQPWLRALELQEPRPGLAQPGALRPQPPWEARRRQPGAVRLLGLPELWRPPAWLAGAWQWQAEPADGPQWAARSGAGEQSCAAPAWRAEPADGRQRAAAERKPPPVLVSPEPRRALLPDAAEANDSAAPRLPLPVSWPGWPSARRRAWRCAIDQSWALCSAGRATPVCLPGCRTAFHAQNAREPCRPRRSPENSSGSCPRPGRALPICQEPAGS